MTDTPYDPPIGTALTLMVAAALSGYFAFAAMQGDNGIFARMQIDADIAELRATRAVLLAEHAELTNLTARLSDTGLDLDLLDERARLVLGYLRPDEVVIP